MTKIDASQVVNRLTLSAILSALREFGINVTSPAEEMSRTGSSTQAPLDETQDGAEVAFDVLISAIEGMGISVTGAPGELRGDAEDTSIGVQTENRTIPTVARSHGSPWANGPVPPLAVSLAGDIAASIVAAYPTIVDPEPAAPAGTPVAPGTPIAAIAPTTTIAAASAAASPVASSSSSEDVQSGPSGFVCTHCNAYNLLAPASETFYTVTAGRAVGVFRGWHNVQPLISGVSHAGYKKYKSKAAAVQAFEEAMASGKVVILQ